MMDDPKIEIDNDAFNLLIRSAEKKVIKNLLKMFASGMDRETSKLSEGFIDILFKHGLTGVQVLGIIQDAIQMITSIEGDDDKHE